MLKAPYNIGKTNYKHNKIIVHHNMKGIQFRSPLHQYSENKVHQVMKKYISK